MSAAAEQGPSEGAILAGVRRPRARPAGTPVEVRDAVDADCARFADIYNEAIGAGRSTMDTDPVDAGHFRRILASLSVREALLAALTPSGVQGWGVVKRYSDRPGYRFACETSLYVAEAATGRGCGSVLQRALLERARALGYRHVVAKIVAGNRGSIRFHERFGYRVVGIQQQIGFLNGSWQDVAILQRILEEPAS